MRRFFLLIITCLVIAGAVSDSERVEVKSGENATLRVEKPGFGNAMLVMLQRNCDNGTEDNIYCSPEEENRGCTANKSERISFMMEGDSFSVILVGVRASDEGCYVVSHVDFANIVTTKKFIVKAHEPVTEREAAVPSQDPTPNVAEHVSQEPVTEREAAVPSQDPAPKGIRVGIKVGIIGVLTVVVIISIICYKKKKRNNHDADDSAEDSGEGIHLKSNTNGEGKPATDESLEIVVFGG